MNTGRTIAGVHGARLVTELMRRVGWRRLIGVGDLTAERVNELVHRHHDPTPAETRALVGYALARGGSSLTRVAHIAAAACDAYDPGGVAVAVAPLATLTRENVPELLKQVRAKRAKPAP